MKNCPDKGNINTLCSVLGLTIVPPHILIFPSFLLMPSRWCEGEWRRDGFLLVIQMTKMHPPLLTCLVCLHLPSNWNYLVCESLFFFFSTAPDLSWLWDVRVILSCLISPVCLNHWPFIWLRFVHIRIHGPPTTALNYQYPDCAVYWQIHGAEAADGFVNCKFFLSVLPFRLGSIIFSKLHAINTQFTWEEKWGLVFVVWVFFNFVSSRLMHLNLLFTSSLCPFPCPVFHPCVTY